MELIRGCTQPSIEQAGRGMSWVRAVFEKTCETTQKSKKSGCLTLQGNEFARKGKWKESGRFGKVRNLQGTEFARNGNCK